LSDCAFVDASLFNQKAGQPLNLARVILHNFDGAPVAGVSNFKTVVLRQPFHKFTDRYLVARNGEHVTAAFEDSLRRLTSAMNCYLVDERQGVGSAGHVSLATHIFTNFDFNDR
jgi:hypothetical protein